MKMKNLVVIVALFLVGGAIAALGCKSPKADDDVKAGKSTKVSSKLMAIIVPPQDNPFFKAEAMGADVLINRSNEDWSKAIFKLTERCGVDVVVDNVGQATWFDSIRALRKGGRMLVVGNTSGPKVELVIRYIFGKHVSILGSTMGTHETFRTVMRLVFDGTLTPSVDRTFSLQEARAAHEYFDSGALFGKVVLVP